MKLIRLSFVVVAVALVLTQSSSLAEDAASKGTVFKFPVGLTFSAGTYEVNDKLKDSLRDNGYTVTSDFVWPVGLSLNPRVEFPMGLGVGIAVGPTEFIVVERSGFSSGSDFNFNIPVGGFVQYSFLRNRNVSPYVRVGAKYPIAGGDYLRSGSVGPFGAAGVEFLRQKRVAFGVEVGYDSSELEIRAGPTGPDRKATPTGLNVSVFVVF